MPDVASLVRGFPRLLGAHKRDGVENHSVARPRDGDRGGLGRPSLRRYVRARSELREADLEHRDDAVVRDLDVGGFQIAMNAAAFVRVFERVGDLRAIVSAVHGFKPDRLPMT